MWRSATNSVECVSECHGHTQSVECVAVDDRKEYFATGSWDNMLKIWTVGEWGRQADRQTEQRDRQADRQTKQRDRQTDRQTEQRQAGSRKRGSSLPPARLYRAR